MSFFKRLVKGAGKALKFVGNVVTGGAFSSTPQIDYSALTQTMVQANVQTAQVLANNQPPPEESWFEKNKTIVLAGGGVGALLLVLLLKK